MPEVPVLCLVDLSADERKAYALADNKIALNAGWDHELLALELQELIDLDFEVELTGFSLAEIDFTLDAAKTAPVGTTDDRADHIPAMANLAVSRPGDLWQLGRHRLLCGDAREPSHFATLMDAEQADIIFTDPPYNVPIDGHVCGLGRIRHREFAMGAGEMNVSEFMRFLTVSLVSMTNHARFGAILFVCMDWGHMRELSEAGR